MKFVCMKCESFMLFQKVEKPAEESLGVMFECPKCGGRFSMVTNPGETAMVNALGVKIGGRTDAPAPFELTRGTLKDSVAAWWYFPAMKNPLQSDVKSRVVCAVSFDRNASS